MDVWAEHPEGTSWPCPECTKDLAVYEHAKVGRVWAMKEMLRDLWSHVYPESAWKFWRRWYFWATHSRLGPIRVGAKTVKDHIANIMTDFKHRVTNAMSESINSKIQTIKQMACGFRNRNLEHFKTAIYFHCGGLNLYPC